MTVTRRDAIAASIAGAVAASLGTILPEAARGSSRAPLTGAGAADSLEQAFRSPGKAMRPWVRWWWPGGAVRKEELAGEVATFDASMFAGGEIQPFDAGIADLMKEPLWGEVNDYATPAFFGRVKSAVEAAAARGLKVDYTFGSAWPSGGGFAINPELALLELTVARTAVSGGSKAPVKVTLPPRTKKLEGALPPEDPRTRDPRVAGWGARMEARQKLIAVVAVKGAAPEMTPPWTLGGFRLWGFGTVVTQPGALEEGSQIVLTDKLRADGTLNWDPPRGRWEVLVFKQYACNSSVMAGVGQGPQLVLDHFKRAAFEAHARRVGDPLIAALGPDRGGLRATFVDSLELMPDIYWCEDFLEQFAARRGYDLVPYLPLILQPGWMASWDDHYSPPCYEMGELGPRVRADYHQTVSDLYVERFVTPWTEWNREHGTLSRFQAHGSPSDTLKAYGLADIPETEDLYCNANPHFMRLARSAARLYGRQLVSAESLVFQNRPFSVTPLELRRRADLIFASGVTELVMHGFPYRFQESGWPGWFPFAPSAFQLGFSNMLAARNPIWVAIPRLATYITRTQAVLRQGEAVVPVALYLGSIGYYTGIEDRGAGKDLLNKALMAGGYDYDRINSDALSRARVEKGRLVAAGGAAYHALIVPPMEHIDLAAIERIAAFAKAGLPVVFVESPPSRQRALKDFKAGDSRVQSAVAAALHAGGRVAALDRTAATLRALHVPANLTFVRGEQELVFIERRVGRKRVYFIHNSADEPRDASFDIAVGGAVQRWDALDGGMAPQAAIDTGAGTRVSLVLQGGESALLLVDPDRKAEYASATQSRTLGERQLPSNGWRLQAAGHGTRQKSIEVTIADAKLADWRSVAGLEELSGVGTYTRTFEVDGDWLSSGVCVTLDLGVVHDLAVVSVNEHDFDPLWHPFTLDVTRALRPGANRLSVAVYNTLDNALAKSGLPGYQGLTSRPAGLLGPVRLRAKT